MAEQKPEDVFIKASEIEVEEGSVTIKNPELASAIQEFLDKDPSKRGVKPAMLSW